MFTKKKTKNIVNLPIEEYKETDVAFFMAKDNPNSKQILGAINEVIDEIYLKTMPQLVYYHTMRGSNARMKSPLEISTDIYAGEPLEVYTSVDAPPFDYLDKYGQVAGVEIDILKYAAQKLSMPINVNVVPFHSIFTNVANKENKFALSGVGVSKESVKDRATKFAFSNPFWKLGLSLICNNDLIFNKVSDLSGFKIGVCESEVGESFINEKLEKGVLSPNTKVVSFENVDNAFKAFLKKKIDCIVVVNYVADGFMMNLRGRV